jgi:hypothetical protein
MTEVKPMKIVVIGDARLLGSKTADISRRSGREVVAASIAYARRLQFNCPRQLSVDNRVHSLTGSRLNVAR